MCLQILLVCLFFPNSFTIKSNVLEKNTPKQQQYCFAVFWGSSCNKNLLKKKQGPFLKMTIKEIPKSAKIRNKFLRVLNNLGGISQCQSSEAERGEKSRWVMVMGPNGFFRVQNLLPDVCVFSRQNFPWICHVESCDFLGWRLWLSMLGWFFDGYRMDSQVWGKYNICLSLLSESQEAVSLVAEC